MASVAQLVEHWSSNPEVAGSIPSQKAIELHFSQLVPVWVLCIYLKHLNFLHITLTLIYWQRV